MPDPIRGTLIELGDIPQDDDEQVTGALIELEYESMMRLARQGALYEKVELRVGNDPTSLRVPPAAAAEHALSTLLKHGLVTDEAQAREVLALDLPRNPPERNGTSPNPAPSPEMHGALTPRVGGDGAGES